MLLHKEMTIRTAFFAGGIATSVASAVGSLPYLQESLGQNGGYVASSVISLGIVAGWDIAFTHKDIKHKAIACSIALGLSCLSGFTIYNEIIKPELNATAKKINTSQQNRMARINSIINNAIADKARLIKLNTEDRAQKTEAEKRLAKHPKFQTTRNSLKEKIKTLEYSISTREAVIEKYSQKIEMNNIDISHKTQSTEIIVPIKNKTVKMAHAAIFDGMTFFLLLLSSFYKKEAQSKSERKAKQLQEELKKELKQARKTKTELAQTTAKAEKTKKKVEQTNYEVTQHLTQDEFYELLANKGIKPSKRGLITPKEVSNTIGRGMPTAKKWLSEAVESGLIDSNQDKSGTKYKYLDVRKTKTYAGDNVVSLTAMSA